LAGTLIAFGVTAMMFWGVFINICMVLGVLPVVGIPLPFFSTGGRPWPP
jgi:rod shape determining protein RodA